MGTIIHVAINGQYAGHIVISDQIREDAHEAISRLKAAGVEKTVMLTGDREAVGKHVAEELGVDEVYAELLPADKVSHQQGIEHGQHHHAIGVKVLVLILATFGLASMWMAVFADVGVMVLAVLNALRALRQ